MTAMCGLAQGYWMLFAARMGVGAGESSYAPATYSILADYFPRDKLAEATGFLANGFNYGMALALILGGAVIGAVERMPDTIIPGIGVMHPWQWAFVAVGLPGLLLALLFQATVKEPKRRGVARAQVGTKPKAVPIKEVFKFLLSDWRTFGPLFAANAIRSLGAGVAVWIPTFYIRTYHWTAPQVGLIQGLMLLCISPIGIWLGGKLSERWTRQGMWDCNMRITFLAGLIALPFGILYPLMPYGWLALTLSGTSLFIAAVSTGPAVAALQLIVPNQMRGQINSLNLLIFNIISAGIGPTFVALFTDYLFRDPADLRYSIVLIALLLNPIATFVIWLGIKPYGRSAKRAAEQFA
jgi:MFS family permease